MFDKEKFLENQELKNTAYAVGYAIGYFEAVCLRAMQSLKVATDQRPLEELDNNLKLTEEEIEIARELYAGIMAISRGEKLLSNYCRKILDFGYRKSFIKSEGLDKWAEEDAFDAVNYILTNFKEWMKRQCKE